MSGLSGVLPIECLIWMSIPAYHFLFDRIVHWLFSF